MSPVEGTVILLFLLLGPLAIHFIERNIEAYCLIIGIVAVTLGGIWTVHLVKQAVTEPLEISAAVVVAGLIFNLLRSRFDRFFARLRGNVSRPILTFLSIFVIAMLSSLITAIVAALVLVETVGLLRLQGEQRP